MSYENMEIGKTIYASQLREKGTSRGTFLRLQIEDGFVWYAANDRGFDVTSDEDGAALEAQFQACFDEQVKDMLQ